MNAGRHRVETESHDALRRQLVTTRSHERALDPLVQRCRDWLAERWRVIITAGSLSGAERIQTLLGEYDIASQVATDPRPVWHWSLPARLEIRVVELSEGFVWPEQGLVVLTDEEIFGVRERKRKSPGCARARSSTASPSSRPATSWFTRTTASGIYRGLMELAAGGLTSELLAIEYLGSDKLFLPVDRLSPASSATAPPTECSPASTSSAAKPGRRPSRKVKASSAPHGGRAARAARGAGARTGLRISVTETWRWKSSRPASPFEETPDQLAAIDDVLADMQPEQADGSPRLWRCGLRQDPRSRSVLRCERPSTASRSSS